MRAKIQILISSQSDAVDGSFYNFVISIAEKSHRKRWSEEITERAKCGVSPLDYPVTISLFFFCNLFGQVLKMAASNKGPKKRAKQLNISTIISGDGRPIRLGRLQEGDRMSSTVAGSPLETQPDSGEDGNIAGG